MSIDVDWQTLTSGPDGERYAEHVRSFVHSRFQSIAFPKFIKSVTVHSFSFGNEPPEIEIKGLCDPYPEFYEEDDEYGSDEASGDGEEDARGEYYPLKLERERRRRERREDQSAGGAAQAGGGGGGGSMPQPPPYSLDGSRSTGSTGGSPFRSPFIPDAFPGRVGVAAGVTTPLFNRGGSSSNLHYFHSALSPGFAGGANNPSLPAFQSPVAKSKPLNNNSARSTSTGSSVPSRPSTADSVARMASLNLASDDGNEGVAPTLIPRSPPSEGESRPRRASSSAIPRLTEPRDEDTQILARVRYAGDLRLELTAELLLEYPITNFVALPVRLVVTGCKFDGLACVAYIRRRAHFCFIDEEQAGEGGRANSVLKEIKVESEIGEKGKGKQVLKNVGKVERFVLEHVRRILEEEFMFPSSWTFLV